MEVDRLELAIQAEATRASGELDKLIGKLNILSNSLGSINTGSYKEMSSGLRQFENAVKGVANIKTSDFTRLSKNANKLAELNHSGLNQSANALDDLTVSLNKIGSVSDEAAKVSDIAKNISKLGNVSMQRTIDNLPRLSMALKEFMTTLSTAPNVSNNIINMTNAMANLASFGGKYNSTINSMSRAANSISKANNNVSVSSRNMASSVTFSLSKIIALAYTTKRAFDYAGNSIEKSMDFTETINLFQTSFKKIGMETAQEMGLEWGSETANQFAIGFMNSAQNFNDLLTESLSLDPNTLMNYQAIFGQMANAFGLTSQSVMNLSSSFTMLGLDISSLFNTGIEEAMVKLRAGLAGEAEPLRTLGIDITQTTLQMTALKYGIEGTVSSMDMATKTQLRWLAIMDQAEVAFGDMAKTIDSPSNQLRVLEQQWSNLSRSIGNVFMPIVSTVLPYINALVIALRRMIDTFATAIGFELPDYSDSEIYTDVTGGINGIGESADDATNSTNKLKKALLGIDELNILSEGAMQKKTSGTGSGSGSSILDDVIGDKTNSYMSKFNEELANMSNKAEELADKIQPKIEALVEWIEKLTPAFAGVAAAFTTYKLITWFSDLAKGIGALSLTPAGVIALAIGALAAVVVAFHKYYDNLVEKDLAKRFGDIELSMKDVKEIAEELTKNDYSANIDIYITEKAKLSEIEKNIEKSLETLNKLDWKVSVGLKLTPEEQQLYKNTIESFIKDTESYIEQQHYVTKLAIDAVIHDENFNAEISALVDEYFNGSKGEMERLGKELRNEMDKALADGILDESEKQVIQNLIKEINEVTSAVSDAEFKAKLKMITVDGDLSVKSFQNITEEVQKLIGERLEKAEEATYTILTAVEAQYAIDLKNATTKAEKEKITKEYEKNIAQITSEWSKTKAVITLDGTEFSLDILNEKYAEELERISPYLKDSTSEVLSKDVLDEIKKMDPSEAMGALSFAMAENYQDAIAQSGISGVSKKGLKEMLEGFEPTEEQLQKIYDDALKTGEKLPEGVSDALTDIKTLEALAGDLDAIAYLMGEKLSTDPVFLETLAKSETAGSDLNKYFINGMKSKIPDLEKQGDKLIFDVDKAIQKATKDSGKNNMPGYAGNMASGLAKGFNDDKTVNKSLTDLLDGVNRTISNWKVPDLKVAFSVTTSAIDEALKGYGMYNFNMPNPYANVKGYATGGFPTPGELFVANEPGNPELIGNIGGRTAVVNPTQIVESVSGGVANAVADVLVPVVMSMIGGSSGGDIIVENTWMTSDEKLYQSTQRGKQKSERRFQTVNQY